MTIYIWDQNLQRCFKALKRTQNTFKFLYEPHICIHQIEKKIHQQKKNNNKNKNKNREEEEEKSGGWGSWGFEVRLITMHL